MTDQAGQTLRERFDEIMEDLAFGHNFDYAGKELWKLIAEASTRRNCSLCNVEIAKSPCTHALVTDEQVTMSRAAWEAMVAELNEAHKGYVPELPEYPACCKNKDGWGYAKDICDVARKVQSVNHAEACTAIAKLADDQHSIGIKNGRFGYVHKSELAQAVEEARIQGWHEGRAAANNPQYQTAYAGGQTAPPHNPTQVTDKDVADPAQSQEGVYAAGLDHNTVDLQEQLNQEIRLQEGER